MKIREWENINSDSLMSEIEDNANLQSIFSLTDQNDIAETIVKELNDIIEILAPARIVQQRSHKYGYQCQELNNLKKESDSLLDKAISSGDRGHF